MRVRTPRACPGCGDALTPFNANELADGSWLCNQCVLEIVDAGDWLRRHAPARWPASPCNSYSVGAGTSAEPKENHGCKTCPPISGGGQAAAGRGGKPPAPDRRRDDAETQSLFAL